ncbi:hypothetical protein FRP1_30085 (plasmid) [Pseudonocardia sp. EC080625-04]|uniref:hypothetical protein n=1 Tax=unclassified Pseudonocardia TaxID=2619320 RepID=UPI0006CB0492|nr:MULTISPECIES: hypothetical protein [unclassified Pseudonocardia]ALE76975.1 hypothetical protein FRP1_30085 [Pseudonocardia sp. EC080625-04]ALL85925.1 hypothetical protein AD017_33070 [Pseudonocardia sp. EC080619-01]
MEALAASFRRVQGAETFDSASQAYLRGELDINAALDEMETFFQGAMIDGRVERDRVVELTKRIETMCGTPSIGLTVTACTLAISCGTC